MNVVLRKEDGSTSALLFVYNMVHTKTGGGSLNLSSLLEIMGSFGKAESATRMSLSRACKAGLLESGRQGKEVVYSITPQAGEYIRNWNAGASGFWKRFALRQQPWDGNWHTATLFLEDAARKTEATETMEELGYAQLSGTQFLGPREQLVRIKECFAELQIHCSIVSVQGEFRTDTGINAFLESTFMLAELQPAYISFIGKYQQMLDQVKAESLEDMFVKQGKALPILNRLGWEFFRIASRDAMLPKALCPDWEGERAAFLMRDLRAVLDDSAWLYLKNHL